MPDSTPHADAAPAAQPSLRRVLGLVFGLAVVVGGVIGSGIMRAPGVVALGLSSVPLTLLLWVAGGALALVTAMPVVEAGASVPRAGGSYAIATRAFGPTAGFMTGWITWLQYTGSNAFIAVVFGEYVHRLGFLTGVPTAGLAVGLIAACSLLNLAATQVSGGSQSLASALKGAVFIAVALVLLVSPRAPPSFHPVAASMAVAGAGGVAAVIMAVRVVYQTYAGWDGAIYFSEEVHDPGRNVARATFSGIVLVTLVYLLVNIALFHVLSPAQVAGSTLAVGDALHVALGGFGDTAVTAIGALSLAAIVNLQVMASSRIIYRMGADGLLPRAFAVVSRGGSPVVAVLAVALVSALLAGSGSYEKIVRIYAPWSIGSIFMICVSGIALRYTAPDLPRPYKTPLFPALSIFAALVQASLIAVVVVDDPHSALWSVLVLFAPLPVLLALRRRRTQSPSP
ncbi:MAG: APC family permease [Alphaproteobacteria bacterium]|nr:APC family permease [Alphaproteobacteria bacterium]